MGGKSIFKALRTLAAVATVLYAAPWRPPRAAHAQPYVQTQAALTAQAPPADASSRRDAADDGPGNVRDAGAEVTAGAPDRAAPVADAAPASVVNAPTPPPVNTPTLAPASPACASNYRLFVDELAQRINNRLGIESVRSAVADRAAMVVLVPDVADARLSYLRRGILDAATLAFEHAGYQIVARVEPTPAGRSNADEAAPAGKVGVLILRQAVRTERGGDVSAGYAPRLVIALLVPERPDTGPDMDALAVSLCAVSLCATTVGSATPIWSATERAVLVGPTFSGSSAALLGAIERYRGETRFVVVNGSASGAAARDFLLGHDGVIDLRSTTLPDDELEQRFYEFLIGAGLTTESHTSPGGRRRLQHVAILRETGSGYGAASTARDPEDERREVGVRYEPELRLTYPLHVAAVRAAYLRQDRLRHEHPQAVASAPLGLSNVLDPVVLQDGDGDRDGDGDALSLLSQDVGLNQMLAESAHEGVRFLGIKATDPADVVFLARRVHDAAPDIRLFILQADQYFLHPAFRRDMLGTFVVTPYPFLGTNPLDLGTSQGNEDADWDHHFSFANSGSEGVHNAIAYGMSFLVRDRSARGLLSEYMPFRCAGTARPRSPRAPHVRSIEQRLARLRPPPVWIAVIGNTGLAPVAVMPGREAPDHRSPWTPVDRSATAGASTSVAHCPTDLVHVQLDSDVIPPRFTAFVLFTLSAFASLLGLWELARGGRRLLAVRDIGRRWRSYYAFLLVESTVVGVALSSLIALQTVASGAFAADLRIASVAMGAGVVASVVTAWLMCFALVNLRREAPDATPLDAAGLLVTLLPAYLAVLALSSFAERSLLCSLPPYVSTPRMFALRALPLLNGVTPMTPWLLLLGSIFWCAHARRKRVLELLTYWSVAPEYPAVAPTGPPDALPLDAILAAGLPLRARWATFKPILLDLVDSVLRGSSFTHVRDALMWPLLRDLFARLRHGGLTTPVTERKLPMSAALGELLPEEEALHRMQAPPLPSAPHLATLVGLWGGALGLMAFFPIETIEASLLRGLLLLALVTNTAVGTATALRLARHWRLLEPLLRRLGTHAVGGAFTRVAPALADRVERQLALRRDDLARMAVCAEMLRAALRRMALAKDLPDALAAHAAGWWEREREIAERLGEAREAAAVGDRVDVALGARVLPLLIATSREVVGALQANWWRSRTGSAGPFADLAAVAEALEAYVATVLAVLVNRQVRPIRWYFLAVVGMAVLTLFALSVYPFRPRSVVLFVSWMTVLVVSGTTLSVYVQMDRNTVLSRIAGTTPGKSSFDLAFFSRIFTLGLVPLLSLVAAQFPQIVRVFYDVLTPFARLLR